MTNSVYQTPSAALEVATAVSTENAEYYVVSVRKLTVLYFATLGLYSVYWFYKNWSRYSRFHNAGLWPLPRGLFNIFFAHSLFHNVQLTLERRGEVYGWTPSGLATGYVALAIASHICEQLSQNGIGFPFTSFASLLGLPLMFLCLMGAQRAINTSQGDPAGTANNRFTWVNYVWVILGVVFWALAATGLALPFFAGYEN